MPRHPINCRIQLPPGIRGFRPYGVPPCRVSSIKLSFEEYESIRLIAHQKLSHAQAAALMNVSRPTATRIYNRAISTIAEAFAGGKAISIEGGAYRLDEEWFRCRKCSKLLRGTESHIRCSNCNVFSENELESLNLKNHG